MLYTKILFSQKKTLKIKIKLYRISSTKWKLRFDNRVESFSHEHLKSQTALFRHFWKLKNKGLTPEIQMGYIKKI